MHLKVFIMPKSNGCNTDVVFVGKNIILMLPPAALAINATIILCFTFFPPLH